MGEDGRRRRALLLVDHRRNGELLREWLTRHGSLEATTAVEDGDVDAVIVDAPSFRAQRPRLRELKRRHEPEYLPLLLVVSSEQAERLPGDVWRDVDEVLTTPVRQRELGLRLERLLALRERSLQAKERVTELGRSNTDLQEFAYAAAHELSNPLTVVTGAIRTISEHYRDGMSPEATELLTAAQQQGERLHQLIDNLLVYARAGTTPAADPVDLGAVAADTLASLEHRIRADEAAVEVGPLPVVVGDDAQLRIVVANLVGNALKYRVPGEPPRIRIFAEETERHWCISVADNGVGIPADRATTVFDMFERGDSPSPRDGHGIGLAICRRAIERHGGEIWVEAAPAGGSVFRFTLPKPAAV